MNNFIVGQVTPDMLVSMKWGTFVFFGVRKFNAHHTYTA